MPNLVFGQGAHGWLSIAVYTSRMKLLRLRGRKVCDRVQRQGRLWKGRTFNVRWLPGHPRHPASKSSVIALYVGTVASTKLDKSAVKRNRMRRRCKEALRITVKNITIQRSYQLLIAPRSSSLLVPFEQIQADVRAFLSSLSHG